MSQLINEIKESLNNINTPSTLLEKKGEEKKHGLLMEMVFNPQTNPYEAEKPAEPATPENGAAQPTNPTTPEQGTPEGAVKPIEGQLPSERIQDPEIRGMLDDIRVAVIKALGKLATHCESEEYATMKKILNIIDKPAESAAKQQA